MAHVSPLKKARTEATIEVKHFESVSALTQHWSSAERAHRAEAAAHRRAMEGLLDTFTAAFLSAAGGPAPSVAPKGRYARAKPPKPAPKAGTKRQRAEEPAAKLATTKDDRHGPKQSNHVDDLFEEYRKAEEALAKGTDAEPVRTEDTKGRSGSEDKSKKQSAETAAQPVKIKDTKGLSGSEAEAKSKKQTAETAAEPVRTEGTKGLSGSEAEDKCKRDEAAAAELGSNQQVGGDQNAREGLEAVSEDKQTGAAEQEPLAVPAAPPSPEPPATGDPAPPSHEPAPPGSPHASESSSDLELPNLFL